MKKMFAILLALVMILSLAACSQSKDTGTDSGNNQPNEEKPVVTTDTDTGSDDKQSNEEKPVLTMATNATFPPYEYHDGETIIGIDAEMAAAIADYLGMKLEIVDIAFDSIIPGIQTGKFDIGMAGMTVTDERLEKINFSESYATGVQVVITKEGSPITSVDDLFAEGASTVVGTQTGTTGFLYATWDIEDAGLGTVKSYPSVIDAVGALKNGQVDCVIADNEPAKALVAANEGKGLSILETEYAVEDYAIAVAKENTELLDNINDALAALTADGTVQSIISKYIN